MLMKAAVFTGIVITVMYQTHGFILNVAALMLRHLP